jgi:Zn-dependent protease with chaperone function
VYAKRTSFAAALADAHDGSMSESVSSSSGSRAHVWFPDISARAFQHPADTAALTALRKVPALDLVLRKLIGFIGERSLRLAHLANAVRVSPRQLPEVHRTYEECLATLGMNDPPELFVSQTPIINAGAIGVERPFIVLTSAGVSVLDETGRRFVIGHELGHILADHALYKTLSALLLRVSAGGLGLGSMALWALTRALLEWDRKSELSADRAGLLCLQDPNAACQVMMTIAAGTTTATLSLEEFESQARDYEAGGTHVDSVFKLMSLLGQTHPFHVLRVLELRRWVESGEYAKVLGGDYPRRTDDPKTSVLDDLRASAASYRDSAQKSADPLVRSLRQMGEDIGSAAEQVLDQLRDRLRNKP